jgi:hypothetical protein
LKSVRRAGGVLPDESTAANMGTVMTRGASAASNIGIGFRITAHQLSY